MRAAVHQLDPGPPRLASPQGAATQPGQHPRIEPVGLGVLGVVVAQVRGLLGRDHDHGCAAAAEPGRQRHPGVTSRLHHHGHRCLGRMDSHSRLRSATVVLNLRPDQVNRPVSSARLAW